MREIISYLMPRQFDMPYTTNIIKLLDKIEPSLKEVLIAILEEIERQREETITIKEFKELHEIVAELAEAQKRTEARVAELAEAQKRTEERLIRLEETVAELAEMHKKLVVEHKKTRENLGGLQHTVGYILEDRAFVGLPPLLEKDFGLKITAPLKRDYIEISPGRYIEVNIIGRGRRDGREVWVIGECKSQVKKREVDGFLRELKELEDVLPGEKVGVIVVYQAPPVMRSYIESKGIKLYFSYQFPL